MQEVGGSIPPGSTTVQGKSFYGKQGCLARFARDNVPIV
jgi:hypothetical protein